jgi:hypothetical protein
MSRRLFNDTKITHLGEDVCRRIRQDQIRGGAKGLEKHVVDLNSSEWLRSQNNKWKETRQWIPEL